jgi:hypothetical protein
MTSYIGAAWRLMRAAMSISTMGAIRRPRLVGGVIPNPACSRVKRLKEQTTVQ